MANKYTFPAGNYYIGDICYVVDDIHEGWENIGRQIGWELNIPSEEWRDTFVYRGHTGFMESTAYGDGYYTGSNGHKFPVDSGSIGILPFEAMDMGGEVFTFTKPFEVYCEDGVFHFGDIVIDTKGDESPWGEDEEDSWDDDEEGEE